MTKDKELTLADSCPKSPRKDRKHEDDGGMFFFRCKWCGLEDDDFGVDVSCDYPRLG